MAISGHNLWDRIHRHGALLSQIQQFVRTQFKLGQSQSPFKRSSSKQALINPQPLFTTLILICGPKSGYSCSRWGQSFQSYKICAFSFPMGQYNDDMDDQSRMEGFFWLFAISSLERLIKQTMSFGAQLKMKAF
jgi:hypothetical protein